MRRVPVDQLQVMVCVDPAESDVNGKKGSLFEQFVARLLNSLGYSEPSTNHLNVTADGIEIDVTARHRLSGARLIAECKAYSKNVPAHTLTGFYGKLTITRFDDPDASGMFAAIPRLTAPGLEQVAEITASDNGFTYLDASGIAEQLSDLGELDDVPAELGDLYSDPMLLVTEYGTYQAARSVDARSRTADRLAVWAKSAPVPDPVMELLRKLPEVAGLPIVDLSRDRIRDESLDVGLTHIPTEEPLIAAVAESSSDFEYQFPTAPRYFVGRRGDLDSLRELIRDRSPVTVVLNAQSGWGKSSLAVRLGYETEKMGGVALILDARTASSPAYVPAALHVAALAAERAGVLALPDDAAFASVSSSLSTLRRANWSMPLRPLLIFFDQFENSFRDEALTRSFRDLSLALRDLSVPLKVGFAWKTDLVGWTEGHPYRLRDDIRSGSAVVSLRPFGPKEITTLLGRLQKEVGVKLDRDLRDRLREYSGGLPWLFKKLAGHVIDELKRGVSQEELRQEALNVQGLFDGDLADLNPLETTALQEIARMAPVSVGELSDRIDASIVQSLLDRRLVVQVGERIDTYWDIFRDYLNTGVVPIKEGFILRLNPSQLMGRLLREMLERGGEIGVSDAAELLGTSEAVMMNTARDLRMVGLVGFDSGVIRVQPAVLKHGRDGVEDAMKGRAANALTRHRVFDLIEDLLESRDSVSMSELARELADAFPAVNARPATWDQYARAFGYWLAYAGIFGITQNGITADPSDTVVDLSLLSRSGRVSVSGAFPQSASGPAMELLSSLALGSEPRIVGGRRKKAAASLLVLGLVRSEGDELHVVDDRIVRPTGKIDRDCLREVLEEKVAGASDAIRRLQSKPDAPPIEIGLILREAQGTSWSPSTTRNAGKFFRSWAKAAGIPTSKHALAALNEPRLFDD